MSVESWAATGQEPATARTIPHLFTAKSSRVACGNRNDNHFPVPGLARFLYPASASRVGLSFFRRRLRASPLQSRRAPPPHPHQACAFALDRGRQGS